MGQPHRHSGAGHRRAQATCSPGCSARCSPAGSPPRAGRSPPGVRAGRPVAAEGGRPVAAPRTSLAAAPGRARRLTGDLRCADDPSPRHGRPRSTSTPSGTTSPRCGRRTDRPGAGRRQGRRLRPRPAALRHAPPVAGGATGWASRCSTRRWRCARPASGAALLAWLLAPGRAPRDARRRRHRPVGHAAWALDEMVAAAASCRRTARVHLKVDTGLGRNGAAPGRLARPGRGRRKAEADGAVAVVGRVVALRLCRRAGPPDDRPRRPGVRRGARRTPRRRAAPEVRHLANSAATLTAPGRALRPGPAGHRGLRTVAGARRGDPATSACARP